MNTEIKWADVAHMYVKSGIWARCDRGKRVFEDALVTDIQNECVWVRCQDSSPLSLSFPYNKHQPILRHREDITDDEAQELFTMLTGLDSIFLYRVCRVTDKNAISKEWCKRLRSSIVLLTDAGSRGIAIYGKMEPSVFLWLIGLGIDIFGLIESGQAIRKEVSNG